MTSETTDLVDNKMSVDSQTMGALSSIVDAAAKSQQKEVAAQDDEDEHDISEIFPPLSREEVMNCTFSLWYPKLQEVTFKSEIIRPLDEKFLAYLLSDGVFLPDDEANPVFSGKFEEHGLSDDENAVKWSDTDNEDDNDVDIDIENTSTEIRKAIERLGGRVFPRMNWTSPRDAVHMTTSDSLKCTNPSQIYLLLKSSYNIASDIENGRYLPREQLGEFKPELVLRQWYNLIPSMEFRCFVKHRKIIAISQIDPHYYDFLEDMRSEILSKIGELFESHVCPSFPSTNYCFDAYIARTIDKTYVVDFEPWTHTVESILFDWEELLEAKGCETPDLRLFPNNVNTMSYFTRKHSMNRYPAEMTTASFQEAMAQLMQQTNAQAQK